MAKYRKKPIVVTAVQWLGHGNHPEVMAIPDKVSLQTSTGVMVEDAVIRETFGWIDTLEGGHIVTPGDYIITGVQGEHYPCKPDIFEATYDLVEEDVDPGVGKLLRSIVQEQLALEDSFDIEDDMNLLDDLGADSLDSVELVMACEEEFNIEIPDVEAERVETVKDLGVLITNITRSLNRDGDPR